MEKFGGLEGSYRHCFGVHVRMERTVCRLDCLGSMDAASKPLSIKDVIPTTPL